MQVSGGGVLDNHKLQLQPCHMCVEQSNTWHLPSVFHQRQTEPWHSHTMDRLAGILRRGTALVYLVK